MGFIQAYPSRKLILFVREGGGGGAYSTHPPNVNWGDHT